VFEVAEEDDGLVVYTVGSAELVGDCETVEKGLGGVLTCTVTGVQDGLRGVLGGRGETREGDERGKARSEATSGRLLVIVVGGIKLALSFCFRAVAFSLT